MVDFTPKYIIIKNYIIDKIKSGEYEIGSQLPSENEIAVMFNVSRVTANKAISDLSLMGIVERVRGKGTFVRSEDVGFSDMSHILSEQYKISPEITGVETHELVSVEFINADEATANKLNIKIGQKVCKVVRNMVSSGEVIGLDYTYIPASILNGIVPDKENIANYYIHDYLRVVANKKPKYIHTHINAKLPDKSEMKLLNADKNTPLLVWDTNLIDEDNIVLAYTSTVAKPEKYRPFTNFELK
ncbi:MAG: GntR family transcriptional regulator [Clostridiaceae bacterium]